MLALVATRHSRDSIYTKESITFYLIKIQLLCREIHLAGLWKIKMKSVLGRVEPPGRSRVKCDVDDANKAEDID